jgi:hypothetical protein
MMQVGGWSDGKKGCKPRNAGSLPLKARKGKKIGFFPVASRISPKTPRLQSLDTHSRLLPSR